MKKLEQLFRRAKTSKRSLWLLNTLLYTIIPFNKPHGLRIKSISDDEVVTFMPYKRKNKNHINGMHACALATLGEFSSGLFLLSKLGASKYRIILKELKASYLYQCKSNAKGEVKLSDEWIEQNIITPLANADKVIVDCDTNIFDNDNNHVATITTSWQLKDWQNVRTIK